ncbi:MAG: nucleotidyltransferase substrate binding protein [Methanobrevibacter sp.]|jgi:nucleotidyltransferase substrate binding protein (TIGR01987 family)|nr:nucleotidyltransferase substrate binding protein [Candidatus Methanoflexus mossambicus]
MDKKIDIDTLIDASVSFSNALKTAKVLESEDFSKIFYMKETVRASVIHHFEFTYELALKTMKSFIEIADGKIENLSNAQLLKKAKKLRVIKDYKKWREFHQIRNLISLAYDHIVIDTIYEVAKEFKIYLDKFIDALKIKIDENTN